MGCNCDLSRLGIPSADALLLGTVDPSNPEPGSGRYRGTSCSLMSFPMFFLAIIWLEILCWEMEEDNQDSKLRKAEPREIGKTHCPFLTPLRKLQEPVWVPEVWGFFFRLFYHVRPKQQHRNHPLILQPLRSHPIFCLLPSFPDFYCTTNGEFGIAACRQRTALKDEQDFSPVAPWT